MNESSKSQIGASTLAALLALALIGLGSPAGAQQRPTTGSDATSSSQLEEVIVTGTRIASASYTSASPLVSIGAPQIAATGQVSLDTALGQMPQFAGAQGKGTVGDPFGTSGFQGGQSYSDLRGLGPERTLVLLDGQRLAPTNPDGSIDLNVIPMALIQAVDVITGGASAVYGSDAMAGVVNFRLLQDFHGIQLSYQHGATTHGDGAENSVSMLMGGNFDEHRGNAVIDLEYNERGDVTGAQRAFFSHNPILSNNSLGVTPESMFSAGELGGNIPISAVNAVLAQYPGTKPISGTGNYGGYIGINSDGTLFTTRDPGGSCVQNYRGPVGKLLGLIISPNCASARMSSAQYYSVQVPMRRYNVFSRVTYNVSDNVQAYGQINFMNSNNYYSSSGTNTGPGSGIYIPQNNPYVTGNSALESILGARTGLAAGQPPSTGPLQMENYLAGWQRTQSYLYNDYQFTGGVKGGIGATNLTWNVFGSYGQTLVNNYDANNTNLPALETIMYGTANYLGSNGANCVGYAWNPLGNQPMSKGCLAYVNSTAKNINLMTQKYFEGDLGGTLWRLPTGDLKFALGADYRGDSFSYQADPGLTPAFNVLPSPLPRDLISPAYDLVSSAGGTQNVREVYLELRAPLLTDKPFAKDVSVDVAGRRSQYDLFGGTNTWKADMRWQTNDTLMLRGSFERAIRAPSLQELYNPTFIAGDSIGRDPCEYNSPNRTGPNAAQVAALCQAQGVPAYLLPTYTYTASDANGIITGNRTLKPEVADTYSFGFVLAPHFQAPMARNLGASVDFYRIKINGAIAGVSLQSIVENCFNANGANPSYSASNFYCQQITRNPVNGFIVLGREFSLNIGSYIAKGLDIEWHWGLGLHDIGLPESAGRIELQSYISYLRSLTVAGVPAVPTLDFAGSIGDTGTSIAADGVSNTDLSHPKWKANTTLGYAVGPLSAALHWRYIDAMADLMDGPNSGDPGIPAYSYFDLDAHWQATSQIQVTAGVTNLFDKGPPFLFSGGKAGIPDLATYDVLGRTYFLGLKATLH